MSIRFLVLRPAQGRSGQIKHTLINRGAQNLWRGPRWTRALLLARLGMIGPFAIDAYLPAFAGIASSIQATPLQMQ